MMIFEPGREQPATLTEDDGSLWIDNGDGTITMADDQDGERDILYDLATGDVWEGELHTQHCRRAGLSLVCQGGRDCLAPERLVLSGRFGAAAYAWTNWGVTL
jgi:hypothetical protein